jgi:hypothetical protein
MAVDSEPVGQGPAPEGVIWNAIRGGLVSRALGLAADLRIARALDDGPRHVDDLARESGADADTLHRLLRALASDGIFAEDAPGIFRNTSASEVLTHSGWDDFARLFGNASLRTAAELDATGEPSFPRAFGAEFWSWLASNPNERAAFDRAMGQGWQGRLERLDSVGWRGDETVVDVGGGNGSSLRALLDRHPDMRGIVLTCPRPSGTRRLSASAASSWREASSRRSPLVMYSSCRRSFTTGMTPPRFGSPAPCEPLPVRRQG